MSFTLPSVKNQSALILIQGYIIAHDQQQILGLRHSDFTSSLAESLEVKLVFKIHLQGILRLLLVTLVFFKKYSILKNIISSEVENIKLLAHHCFLNWVELHLCTLELSEPTIIASSIECCKLINFEGTIIEETLLHIRIEYSQLIFDDQSFLIGV